MIYIPWDRNQKLLPDPDDFDHRPYENMRRYAPDFEVKLWTWPRVREFCERNYPAIWALLPTLARPTMMVDVLRWLVVYHFGGIYWQYEMDPLVPMAQMLPGPGYEVRLFTEFVNDEAFCRRMAAEPIRQGEPEEPVRIANQAFSAIPRHRFIRSVLDLIVERASTLRPQRDYDILYICANAAVSTAYDRFGKNDPTVERIGWQETRRMMKFSYRGRWRTESSSSASSRAPLPKLRWRHRLRRHLAEYPTFRRCFHRWIRPHVHEQAIAAIRSESPKMAAASEQVYAAVAGAMERLSVRRILSYPAAHFPELSRYLPRSVQFVAADMVRGQSGYVFWNALYDPVPPVDLVLARNLFEYLENKDVLTILRRVHEAGVRYLLTTNHPCLNSNWNTFTGEWRPVNLTLEPFSLPQPELEIPDPDLDRRPDRCLALFVLAQDSAR